MIKRIILPLCLLAAIVAAIVAYFSFFEKRPEFPLSATGEFLQEPRLAENNEFQVTWTLPESCQSNEMLYSDSRPEQWGGIHASCLTTEENTSVCSVDIRDVLQKNQSYTVQASSKECESQQTFVSAPTPLIVPQ